MQEKEYAVELSGTMRAYQTLLNTGTVHMQPGIRTNEGVGYIR